MDREETTKYVIKYLRKYEKNKKILSRNLLGKYRARLEKGETLTKSMIVHMCRFLKNETTLSENQLVKALTDLYCLKTISIDNNAVTIKDFTYRGNVYG